MTGTGTQNDPYVVTSMEEVKELIEGYEDIVDPDSGTTTRVWTLPTDSTTYIEFPDVYAGPKIMDYRNRGWNPFTIMLGGARQHVTIHIHFNGWTILGLSIMDIDYWLMIGCRKSSGTDYGGRIFIYDLIMKNVYVLANSSDTTLFSLWTDSTVGGSSLTEILRFYNCKFSAVLDAQNSTAYMYDFYRGGSTSSYMTFDTCSFNIKLSTRTSNKSATIVKNNYGNGWINNCLYNLISNNYTGSSTIISCSLRFCKFTGSIRIPFDGNPTISLGSTSVYNVVDMEVINCSNAYGNKLKLQGSSGINIVNKTRLRAEGTYPMSIENSDVWKIIENAADFVNPSYLNSIDFICGDAPT